MDTPEEEQLTGNTVDLVSCAYRNDCSEDNINAAKKAG
jgi:hypothetical protein